MSAHLREQDWQIRLHVYRYFVKHARPPTHTEIADSLDIPPEEVRQAYHRLHQGHALFLEPGTDTIRMANPLSAVPTSYRVDIDGYSLFANCAWDSLGIPAMLHGDARIEATFALSGETVRYAITDGQLDADDLVVHFSLPFRCWYDNLIHT